MGLNNATTRDLIRGQHLSPDQQQQLEGIVSEVYSHLDDMTADVPIELAGHVAANVAIKAMITLLAKHEHLSRNSVDPAEFRQCVRWFAYELATELQARTPGVMTDDLVKEIAEGLA